MMTKDLESETFKIVRAALLIKKHNLIINTDKEIKKV